MFRFSVKLIFILIALSVLLVKPATAVKIVRLELEYGSDFIIATGGYDIPKTNKVLDLELYENETPVTVANFLNYVNTGRYDLTFINRSISDFVLQTGGVNNIVADPENEPLGPTTFGEVEEFPPILNEPGLSNIRGTIAMARQSGVIDSANSEWFINLSDNISLDTVDEGFTVFGDIIDDGMETADQIAEFPFVNLGLIFGGSYTNLPIADADPNPDPDAGPVANFTQRNLVMILSATKITRPILRFTPAIGDFDFDNPADVIGKSIDVKLKNTGNETLNIGPISGVTINAPFTILSENCSNTSLEPISITPTSFCTLSIQFLPTETGIYNGSLMIDYSSLSSGESFSVKYHLLGKGAMPIPTIVTADELDIGTSQVDGFSSSAEIIISNYGEPSLQVIALTGLDSTDFSQTNDCIGSDVLFGESCTIAVTFTTSDSGPKDVILSVESNDPVNNIFDILLTGNGDNDADGITSEIEDAAPNAGDNNFDGTADSLQNDIASFTTNTGDYISLVVDSSNVVSNISANQLIDLPTDVEFKHGVLEFDVVGLAISSPGAIIQVGLVLPVASGLEAYYLFGEETADNATPHWYRYAPVQVLTNGQPGPRDRIVLTVQDGGSGDADQMVNGIIRIGPGAPAYSTKTSSGSGSSAMNILFLGIFALSLITLQRRYR